MEASTVYISLVPGRATASASSSSCSQSENSCCGTSSSNKVIHFFVLISSSVAERHRGILKSLIFQVKSPYLCVLKDVCVCVYISRETRRM